MNKTQKPAGFKPMVAPAQRPLTEEEKKVKIMQFLQQKRETFAVNILCNLVHSQMETIINHDDSPVDVSTAIVKVAVKMADNLIGELYPMPEEADQANQ